LLAVFFNAVAAVVVLLLLMLVGYLMGLHGWMGPSEKKFLGKYIINIAVPCNSLVGLLNNLDRDMLTEAGVMLVCCILGVVVNFLIGAVLATLLKLPRERWGVFVCMLALSNTIFIGLPLCTQLFGEVCIPYIMLYYLANTIFTQSLAVVLVERAGTKKGTSRGAAGFVKDLFTKPPILAVIVSLGLLVANVRPPEIVMTFSKYISNSVSPLALIYCGYIVYELGLKSLRFHRGLGILVAYRLVLSPVVCALLCRGFGISGLPHDVFVVGAGLPVVSQVTVMAGTYGADDKYAATGATLSTLGCFFTIPVLMVLLG